MIEAALDERPQPIAEVQTNTKRESTVEVHAEHPPILFLHTETGELIAVPVEERNALIKEIGQWNMLVATLHDANAQVQYFEAERTALALKSGTSTATTVAENGTVISEKEALEKNWKIAVEWQEEVLDACRSQIKSLDKIGDAGKQLLELIPIPTKKKGNAKAKEENDAGKFEDGKYSGAWKNATWGKGNKRVASRDWIRPPMGSLVYVPSDQIKKHWPKIKDPKAVKWQEVLAKDAQGKRKIDHAKLKAYTIESVKKVKLQSKDFIEFEADVEGSVGAWATAWNSDTSHRFSKQGKLTAGPVTGDIEVDAGAQFMRYLYGGSLNATFEPFKGNVAFHADGHAEFALAEAKAHGAIYFPSKDGWMWTLPAALVEKNAKAEDVDLGAVRLMAALELSGVVGASVAAEGSLGIETKEGRFPQAKGKRPRKRGKRRTRNIQVFGPPQKMKVADFDFELNAFAGAKADAELKGAIEWRNPEDKERSFTAFAEIVPALGGMAGVGADVKLSVQYTNGIFKVHADAAICIGLGAEGKIGFEVNVKLMGEFVKWFFYQLYNANFTRLGYIKNNAFDAARDLAFIAISEGKAIEEQFGMLKTDMEKAVKVIRDGFVRAEVRQQLAHRILSDPEALRYASPETKGMLIYQLSRHSSADWATSGLGLGDNFLYIQKAAIKYILRRWSHTRADCNNVIQHIAAHGERGDLESNRARLNRFFSAEAPHDLDLPGIESHHGQDFDDWYNKLTASLKIEPTRGYPVVPSDSVAYALQRDGLGDHPMFASSGDRAFYA